MNTADAIHILILFVFLSQPGESLVRVEEGINLDVWEIKYLEEAAICHCRG